VVALVSLPSLPTIITGLTSRQHAGIEEGVKLLQIFLFTFPLTIGVAICTIIFIFWHFSKWERDTIQLHNLLLIMFAILGVSAWVGNKLGLGVHPVDIPSSHGGSLKTYLINLGIGLLFNYLSLYGPQMFFSSILVGIYMGWAFTMKLLPHLIIYFNNREQPKGEKGKNNRSSCPQCGFSYKWDGNLCGHCGFQQNRAQQTS
jgi:hypothetical protein